MRRPAVRFLLTLVLATSVIGVVPATSEAGIVPWAWDTLFGPVGSIQARRAARYGAGCCGPAPVYAGFRGGFRGLGGGCCATSCNSCGVGGYSNYGGYASAGCSSCGGGGCSSCGTGYGGGYYGGDYYDGGYGASACGPGGCSTGQCNVNYPPGTNSGNGGPSPVTPAPVPNPNGAGPGTGPVPGGPSPSYDRGVPPGPGPGPMGPTSSNDGFVPPVTPAPGGAAASDGFTPANSRGPAPSSADPSSNEFVPPKTNNPGAAADEGVDPAGGSTVTPPSPPRQVTPPKRNFGDEDDKGTSIGPRFELNEKVTWRPAVERTRTNLSVVRVSAHANRYGIFAKTAWRSSVDAQLAKK